MTVLKQLYLDIDGNEMTVPKTRSYKAIVKRINAGLHKPQRSIMNAKERMAAKALDYVLTMRGENVPFTGFNFKAVKMADFAMAPDGSVRVRAINLDGEIVPIPHWDFTPEIIDESISSTRIEHAYGSTTRLSFQINVF